MSLGVAAIIDGHSFLMADTLLSFPEKSGKKPSHGLKVFFLNESTSVAYSGAAGEVAHGRLHAIYMQGYKDDIKILAEQICNSFDHEVDFLLAKSGEDPLIAKISDGKVSIRSDSGVYWIGDGVAARHLANTDTSTIFKLQSKFEEIIEHKEFSTVGGHCVVAKGGLAGFKYIPYMNLVSPRYFPKVNEWEAVSFGTAQSGGFGFTTVVPSKEGVNGWGLFYFQGMFGEFWHINIEKNICELLRVHAKNVHDFIEIIQKEISEDLTCCGSLY
ncbi:MAG: hypothetical protein ACI9W6_002538 [Motiliproteus sp.]|jgi:hypothetical protein